MSDPTRPDTEEFGVPTQPMQDPTPPDVPIDAPRAPKHSLADGHIGGTLGDPENQ